MVDLIITMLMALIATYLLLFKTGWCLTHLHLFGMRKYISSNEYCKTLKKCDIALIFHYLKMVIFGLFLMVEALGLILNPTTYYIYVIALLLSDMIIHDIVFRNSLISLKNTIEGQWSKQEKITETHDDEVRIVKALQKIHYTIPYTMLMITIIMLCSI